VHSLCEGVLHAELKPPLYVRGNRNRKGNCNLRGNSNRKGNCNRRSFDFALRAPLRMTLLCSAQDDTVVGMEAS